MNALNKLCAIDRRRRTFALSLLLLLATAAALHRSAQHPPNALLVAPLAKPVVDAAPFFVEQLASKRHNVQTHAATLIELRDGRVRGFWSAGSREGAKDVRIDSAVYDPTTRKWSEQRAVVGRIQTQRALWRRIKKLGNPVVARLPSGDLALFYVSVSVGGWSGSSLSVIVSDDDGATWRRARRLITSPFFNLATLVKGAPYQYADGGLGLPVYHELFAKFGEVLRLSPNALTVLDKRRLSAGADGGLQPVVLIDDARNASALMRYAGQRPRRVLLTETADAARYWRAPVKTTLAQSGFGGCGVGVARWRLVGGGQSAGTTARPIGVVSVARPRAKLAATLSTRKSKRIQSNAIRRPHRAPNKICRDVDNRVAAVDRRRARPALSCISAAHRVSRQL